MKPRGGATGDAASGYNFIAAVPLIFIFLPFSCHCQRIFYRIFYRIPRPPVLVNPPVYVVPSLHVGDIRLIISMNLTALSRGKCRSLSL